MANPTTPFNYDYSGFTDDSTYATPCSWDGLNILGARLSILFYFMFLFSVCGNALVLVIIHRFEKLTTVTNILLLNLVVSSLIFMSSLPFVGVYLQLSYWAFGKVMCKIVGTVYYLGFYSSVLFLTLLTIDRHLAVVYSLNASQVRCRSYAVISCAVVWLVSGLACIRPMIIHTTFNISGDTYCQEYRGLELEYIDVGMLRSTGLYLQIILFLIIPLTVFIYCYIRIAITVIKSKIVTKFKTVRLIFVIVLLFFLCWTPYNIALIMNEKADGCHQQMKWGYTLEVTRVIAYIYFCISPLFYTFVGKKFQNYFRQLLVTRFPQLKKHVSVSPQSGSNMSTKSTRNEL